MSASTPLLGSSAPSSAKRGIAVAAGLCAIFLAGMLLPSLRSCSVILLGCQQACLSFSSPRSLLGSFKLPALVRADLQSFP